MAMSRWSGLAIVSLTSLLCLLPSLGEAPPAATSEVPAPASTSAAPAVRIQHEIVTVPYAVPRARTIAPGGRFRSARALPRRPTDVTAVARARRMLLGDGTYRPEPFPRPTRD